MTEMIASREGTKKMVAPKTVKIEALQLINVNGREVAEGEVVEVSAAEADQFCKVFEGTFAFGGERSESDAPRHQLVRAKRV